MHISTRYKCDNPLKIDRLWHLNDKKYSFRELNRDNLSRFVVACNIPCNLSSYVASIIGKLTS